MEAHSSDSTSRPLSRASTSSSHTVRVSGPPSEVLSAQYSIGVMQGGLEALDDVLSTLTSQVMHAGHISGSEGIVKDIDDLRAKLQLQETRQIDGMHEIELIMKDLLEDQVIAELKKQVDEELDRDLEHLVAEQVKECLKTAIPEDLQKDVASKKLDLEGASANLHNSESRRANALLRERNQNEPLHTIYKADGTISEHFPKTLKQLFELDAKTCKGLVEEYGIANPTDSRDGNLNRFLVFCGVQYQMVRSGLSTKRVGVEAAGSRRKLSPS